MDTFERLKNIKSTNNTKRYLRSLFSILFSRNCYRFKNIDRSGKGIFAELTKQNNHEIGYNWNLLYRASIMELYMNFGEQNVLILKM